MTQSPPWPIYHFSDLAIEAIVNLRVDWNSRFPDKVATVGVAWGTIIPNNAHPFQAVVISFYPESQMAEMGQHVVKVDGMDVINFLLPKDFPRFEGKIIDYADNRGFFLR